MRILLFFLSLTGIFISGSLFFRSPFFRNRTLSFFVLLFSFQILNFLYATSEIVFLYPQFVGLYFFPSSFLYGPLFYFHIMSFQKKDSFRWLDIIHFFPSLIIIILTRDIYQMESGLERIELFKDQFLSRFLIYNYAIVVQVIFYALLCLMVLKKFIGELKHTERLYIIGTSAIYVISGITLALSVEFANSWREFLPYYLMVSLCFLVIGFLLYTNPKFLNDWSKKYLSSNLSSSEMKEIVNELENLFEREKLFLEKGLTIKKISAILDIPSYKISQSLSSAETNFNEFCNRYRVEYSVNLLKSPKLSHYKIEAIAMESGFSNKVTFYRAFSKTYGYTPASYRDNCV